VSITLTYYIVHILRLGFDESEAYDLFNLMVDLHVLLQQIIGKVWTSISICLWHP
jgi:hypothetical protein